MSDVSASSEVSEASEVIPGRESASATIWRSPAPPDARPVRRRAVVRWLIACCIGALLFAFAHTWLAVIAWAVSTAVLALALLSPHHGHAALERGLGALTGAVGRVLTWILLAPLFYLVLTPFGLLRRRGTRDTLTRRFEPERESYWTRREPESEPLEHPY